MYDLHVNSLPNGACFKNGIFRLRDKIHLVHGFKMSKSITSSYKPYRKHNDISNFSTSTIDKNDKYKELKPYYWKNGSAHSLLHGANDITIKDFMEFDLIHGKILSHEFIIDKYGNGANSLSFKLGEFKEFTIIGKDAKITKAKIFDEIQEEDIDELKESRRIFFISENIYVLANRNFIDNGWNKSYENQIEFFRLDKIMDIQVIEILLGIKLLSNSTSQITLNY